MYGSDLYWIHLKEVWIMSSEYMIPFYSITLLSGAAVCPERISKRQELTLPYLYHRQHFFTTQPISFRVYFVRLDQADRRWKLKDGSLCLSRAAVYEVGGRYGKTRYKTADEIEALILDRNRKHETLVPSPAFFHDPANQLQGVLQNKEPNSSLGI